MTTMETDEIDVRVRQQLGLLTEEEVAALAGNDVLTVRNWRTTREGPPFTKLGRRALYRIEAVKQYLIDREKQTA